MGEPGAVEERVVVNRYVPLRAPGGGDGGDSVDHPVHYTSHPARCEGCGRGIECIQVTEHMGFNLGNVVKYVWRADLKGNPIDDLRKARWYLDREIQRRERQQQREVSS